MIVGIDEVGRGAWAGPLVVGAVALSGNEINGLTDSKKLTAKKRQVLSGIIRKSTSHIGLGWVAAETIDKIGLSMALKVAAVQALAEIKTEYDEIIIDGTIKLIDDPRVSTLKQADLLVPSVSAASIIAKVARDFYMRKIAADYPEYGFEKHVGYGTNFHREAIAKHGPSKLHRMSFSPMSEIVVPPKPTVKSIGKIAEDEAAKYLQRKGYRVIDKNWKTKYCEIDIIAEKNNTIYFVEVKYRRQENQGGGIAAITPKKLKQMKFATEFWRVSHPKQQNNVQLAVISMSGISPQVKEFLKLV